MDVRAILVGAFVAAAACECTTARADATTTGGEMLVAPMTDATTFESTTTGIDYAITTGGYVFDLGPPPPPIPLDFGLPDHNSITEMSGPAERAISEIDGPAGEPPSEIGAPRGNDLSEMHGPPVEHSDPISEIPPGS